MRGLCGRTSTTILRAIAHGRAWLQEIIKGEGLTPAIIAEREGQTERWIRKTLSPALFDPKLLRAAIAGQLPRGFGVKRLSDLPTFWPEQWRALATRPDTAEAMAYIQIAERVKAALETKAAKAPPRIVIE